jgi:hypothetical protein
MLTAVRVGTALNMLSLDSLFGLPHRCLDALEIRSLVISGPCHRVLDRGKVVLETRSVDAANVGAKLVQHLVRGARVDMDEGTAQQRDPLFVVSATSGIVTDFRWAQEGPSDTRWVRIDDWRR